MPNILKKCQTVFQTATPFYVPASSARGFQFLPIFTEPCNCLSNVSLYKELFFLYF